MKNYLYNNISFVYDVSVNYVEAHEECLRTISNIVHNDEIIEKLQKEIHDIVKHAENKLYNDMEENYPDVIKAVQHKRGAFFLINRMTNFVTEMIEHGQMDFKEAKLFLYWLDKETNNLELNNLKIDFEEADLDFQQHCELAKILSQAEIDHLCTYFEEHTYNKDDVIIRKDEKLTNLYYISKGIVHEKNGPIDDLDAPKIKNRQGDVLGLQFIAKDEGRSFTNCYAKTVCTVRTFPISVLKELLRGDSEKEQKIWNYIGPSIVYLNPDTFTRLQELDALQIKVLQKNSIYRQYEAGDLVTLENGGILFEGT